MLMSPLTLSLSIAAGVAVGNLVAMLAFAYLAPMIQHRAVRRDVARMADLPPADAPACRTPKRH